MAVLAHRVVQVDKFSTALTIKEKVYKLAEIGQTDLALKLISDYVSSTITEDRILGHSQAEILMISGKTKEALEILLSTQKRYGNHVALLTDITICYYTLSDFKNWKFAFNDLKKAYFENKDILTFERRIMAELNIAKFTEEDGDIATAATNYLRIMKEMNERHDMPRFYRSISQALRVLATFRITGQLAEIYRQMISVGKTQVGLVAHVDVQQALLISELVLIGPQSASSRLIEVLKNDSISIIDKQILYYDFIEEHLLHGFDIEDQIISYATNFRELNAFEHEIQKIAFINNYKTELIHLTQLSTQLPLSSFIRILGVHLARSKNSKFTTELRSQFKLLISTLNSESQQYWISRYKKFFLANEELQISYDSRSKILSYNNNTTDLSRRSGFQGVIELFNVSNSLETETVIRKLWNVSFDPNYYKSLRMTVHRLNEIIFNLTGIPKAIEINKQKLEIKGKITFKVI